MLNKKLLNTLVLAALAVPTLAMAEDAPASPHTVTGNVGMVSNYVFRGITQTSHNPAVQGGFDYAHASGLYAGVWGSNVSWIADSGAVASGSVGMELDTYAGFKNTFAEDFSYDIGFVRYNYLGKYTPAAPWVKADTDEVYGSIGYKWISAKYSYGLGKFLTIPDAQGTNYIELNANYPVSDTGITLGAHVGKQTYKGSSAAYLATTASGSPTYTDYKVSISKDFSGYVLGLAYSKTNASNFYNWPTFGGNWGKGVAILSLTHAM
ncbi:exported protein [Ferriphaselus amnicola]|uniref:Exported protein n=1 Tax=Ferriphaselus amnicola TaxID=1188319 RepID=A0A2Z6GEJ5_9PROT|nr:TorF family putative porin [Ferriphaselus amnicola]BBE51996.1 exported protein [Ferriphaselus amnicola]